MKIEQIKDMCYECEEIFTTDLGEYLTISTVGKVFLCSECLFKDAAPLKEEKKERHKPEGSKKLYVIPVSKKEAENFIIHVHRHHMPISFGFLTLAVCSYDGTVGIVHGVCTVGRPTTQHLTLEGIQNEWIAEVRRVATDGTKNACSALYAACWNAVRSMGYRALVSYTLPEEGGASLRALGWKLTENVGGNTWAHRNKSKVDIHPVGKKLRWEVTVQNIPPFSEVQWPVYDSVQKSILGEPTVESQGIGARMERTLFDSIFTEGEH